MNLKEEETKERDAAEIKSEVEGAASIHEVLKKHLTLDQKTCLMLYIKQVCESNEARFQVRRLLEKDELLAKTLFEVQEEVLAS